MDPWPLSEKVRPTSPKSYPSRTSSEGTWIHRDCWLHHFLAGEGDCVRHLSNPIAKNETNYSEMYS
jgi:hypothetical protein